MARAWMPMYWGDYLRDTADLSLIEHGAYVKLLSAYYSTGKPLPANAKQLLRICSAFDEAEQQAMHLVLGRFFTKEGDVYRHKRADAEIAKAVEISEKRAEAGALGAKAKAQANGKANAGANAYTATATATTTNTDTEQTGQQADRFEDFWSAYPRKVKKKQARDIWKRRKLGGMADTIIADVQARAKRDPQWLESTKLIPHPPSYLNAERWTDEWEQQQASRPEHREFPA